MLLMLTQVTKHHSTKNPFVERSKYFPNTCNPERGTGPNGTGFQETREFRMLRRTGRTVKRRQK